MPEVAKSTRKPKESRFTQQKLGAIRPVLTPPQVILVYLVVGVSLIPIGAVLLNACNQVNEISQRYDNHAPCIPNGATTQERIAEMQQANRSGTCLMQLRVEEDMEPPIYVYYELEDYFQNHRRYVKSRDDDQLVGENGGDMSDCRPKLYQHPENNEDEEPKEERLINPCGLTAWSFFNDTFQFANGAVEIEMSEEGIAWESDMEKRFGDHPPQNFNNLEQFRGGGVIEGNVNEDEHFIVWMRTASLPTFRKLYGIINQPLSEGATLDVTIENLYNTYLFGGKKRIVLSTTSWLGGRNEFIGYLYITAGCISIVMALVYFLLHIHFPRDLGDERFLSWRRKNY